MQTSRAVSASQTVGMVERVHALVKEACDEYVKLWDYVTK